MNKKTKVSTQTIVRYIRDFSIVVAGIAVTLYVNYKVTNQGEKRDMNLYLNAIKIELEENLKGLDMATEYYQQNTKYSEYLKSHDKKSIDKDSVESYKSIFFVAKRFSFKTNAFEMFKYSGTMRLLADKEFLLSMWNVYDGFSVLKELLELDFQMKTEALRKEVSLAIENNMEMTNIPIYDYYIFGISQSALQSCEELLTESKELVKCITKLNYAIY
jgi:hypothetical protein